MEEELHRAHAELELRVQKRTAELVKINENLQTEIIEHKQTVADRYHRRQAGEDIPHEYEFHMLHMDGRTRIRWKKD